MNIYDVLNSIIKDNTQYYAMNTLFTKEDMDALDGDDVLLFDVINKISSLGTNVNNDGITFIPRIDLANGNRSFDISDLTENDYKLLESIDLYKLPLALRSLISDILWTQKKNYTASKIAAQSYWEIFEILYDSKDYHNMINPLRRAVCISANTKLQSLYSEIYDWFCSVFISNVDQISVFCSLKIIELFFEQKNADHSIILPVLDSIIFQNIRKYNISAVEQAYALKAKCFIKLKKNDEATKSNIALAQFYYDFAERMVNSDPIGAFRSIRFFEKSVYTFRNNGDTANAEKVHRRLIEVQKQILPNMHTFRTTFDISKVIENIKTNMDGLSFEECIIRFTQYVNCESIDTLRKRTIEECTSDPLSSLFETDIIDAQGRTIIKMAPLDYNNPEKDQDLLELHMFYSSLQAQRTVGNILVKNILHYIRNRFSINDSMVEFLTKENCIIPEGRETIFQKGIGCFLRGEYYEAMHILAPQMENLFRNLANEVGGLTSTLSDQGLAQEKVLSSVFSLPELLDAYDNDIIFTFRGLLNEQAGANIRNRIAHGIINESECSSGECLYFGALVIKLISYTSSACNNIINNSEKIQGFKIPEKDSIKIVN